MQQCALTGGIGSGKSTVADGLESEGFPVLRADRLAAEAVAPGTAGLQAVVEHFGPGVVRPDGSLDRKGLGDIVFADPHQKQALEAIVHPAVQALYDQKKQALEATGAGLLFYEIPLLVETQRAQHFDAVIAVTAPYDVRIARVIQRSGLSQAQVQARLANQATDFQRICVADLVIHNDQDLAALAGKLGPMLEQLRRRLAFKQRIRATHSPRRPASR